MLILGWTIPLNHKPVLSPHNWHEATRLGGGDRDIRLNEKPAPDPDLHTEKHRALVIIIQPVSHFRLNALNAHKLCKGYFRNKKVVHQSLLILSASFITCKSHLTLAPFRLCISSKPLTAFLSLVLIDFFRL